MAAIYAVENVENKRSYVGFSSQTLNRRLNEHRSRMRKGTHEVKDMVLDFEKYGGKAFRIVVLETLPKDVALLEKRHAELKWMHHFKALGLLYNTHLISFQMGPGHRLRSHTAEANEKRRLSQLGKPKGHGAKISATKKALGQRPSLEAASKGGKVACQLKWHKS